MVSFFGQPITHMLCRVAESHFLVRTARFLWILDGQTKQNRILVWQQPMAKFHSSTLWDLILVNLLPIYFERNLQEPSGSPWHCHFRISPGGSRDPMQLSTCRRDRRTSGIALLWPTEVLVDAERKTGEQKNTLKSCFFCKGTTFDVSLEVFSRKSHIW